MLIWSGMTARQQDGTEIDGVDWLTVTTLIRFWLFYWLVWKIEQVAVAAMKESRRGRGCLRTKAERARETWNYSQLSIGFFDGWWKLDSSECSPPRWRRVWVRGLWKAFWRCSEHESISSLHVEMTSSPHSVCESVNCDLNFFRLLWFWG